MRPLVGFSDTSYFLSFPSCSWVWFRALRPELQNLFRTSLEESAEGDAEAKQWRKKTSALLQDLFEHISVFSRALESLPKQPGLCLRITPR